MDKRKRDVFRERSTTFDQDLFRDIPTKGQLDTDSLAILKGNGTWLWLLPTGNGSNHNLLVITYLVVLRTNRRL